MDEASPVNHINEDSFFECLGSSDLKGLRYLLDQGISPNVKTAQGQPAIVVATLNQDPDVVQLLLAAGANPDLPDETSQTALFYSVAQNTNAIQEALLVAGAQPDFTPSKDLPLTPLNLACLQGNLTAMHRILIEHRSKVSEAALGDALFFAGFYGQYPALRYLLEDVEISPLATVSERAFRFLYAQVSEASGFKTMQTWLGEHPISYWMKFPLPFWMTVLNRSEFLRLLLQHGVAPDHLFTEKICLPKIAAMEGDVSLLNVLIEAGWSIQDKVCGRETLKEFLSREGFSLRHRNLLRRLKG